MPASSARDTAWSCSDGSPRVIKPPTAPHPNPSADTFSPVFPSGRCSIALLRAKAERRGVIGEVPRPQLARLEADHHGIAGRPRHVFTSADLAQVARSYAPKCVATEVFIANDAWRDADFDA